MKPFLVVRSIMDYMGYHEDAKNPIAFPLNSIMNLIFWLGTWYYSLPAAFYFGLAAQNFLEYSDSFYFIVDGFMFVFIWVVFLWLKPDVLELIQDFEQLIQHRNWLFQTLISIKNPLVTELNIQTDESVERLTTKFHYFMTRILMPSFTVPMYLTSMLMYFANHGCTECLVLPIPALFPFDYQTPLYYTITVSLQLLGMYCIIEVFFTETFLFVGMCRFATTLSMDLNTNVKQLADDVLESDEKQTPVNHIDLRRKFIEIIRFHAESKQLTYKFSALNTFIVFISLVSAIVLICCSLLQLQYAFNTENYVLIPRPIMSNITQFSWIFLLCNNGNAVSAENDKTTDSYFHCSWYLMPKELQKCMPIILNYSQRDIEIAGVGGLACNRDTFKKVVKGSFSYFITFQRFN